MSGKIKRYECTQNGCENGYTFLGKKWCASEDVEKLEAEIERLKKEKGEAVNALKCAEPILHLDESRRREMEKGEAYEKTFEEFWKEIIVREDGTWDHDAIMRELYDYSICMEECAKVYMHVTGGLLSKPNTAAEHVIGAFDESLDEGVYEELARWRVGSQKQLLDMEQLRGLVAEVSQAVDLSFESVRELLYKKE